MTDLCEYAPLSLEKVARYPRHRESWRFSINGPLPTLISIYPKGHKPAWWGELVNFDIPVLCSDSGWTCGENRWSPSRELFMGLKL